MTFDGHHKGGDADAGRITPPSGDHALNGHDLLKDHKSIVKAGDTQVAGNPKFEVGDTTPTPALTADAVAARRTDVAAITGGDPSKPDQLALTRQQQFADGQAAIAGISTPEQGHALMGQLNDQTAQIMARIKALSAYTATA